MSERRLSTHRNVTSDRPAYTDLGQERNKKEDADLIHEGTGEGAFHAMSLYLYSFLAWNLHTHTL